MASIVSAAATAAHSAIASLVSQIKPGAQLPAAGVKEDDPTKPFSLAGKVATGTHILVTVPAAFSPTCSNQVPGYIEKYPELEAKGVQDVWVIGVNDVFVMEAWKQKLATARSGGTLVHFIADDTGAFASALGLIFDATPLLGGPRLKRAVLIVKGGKVEDVIVEEDPSKVTVTSVDNLLSKL
ncbi:Redoxin [Calocera viscosa TUFC12733]|uniref:Redoxin n=1 Tax=Calocera viscosa (strain TUFC12733) TaxID=1330018 RepID=A0A167H9J1_CALVF|nr:Redoxin [Calocera viscosa TUFC12733]